jgi:MAP/microtubule affinity-regulating kinase
MLDILIYLRLANVEVAIKIIDKSRLDAYSLKNLYRETEIMKNLNHGNIIRLFEIIEVLTGF